MPFTADAAELPRFPLTPGVPIAQLLWLAVAFSSVTLSSGGLTGGNLSVSKVKNLRFLIASLLPSGQGQTLCYNSSSTALHGIRLGLAFSVLGPPSVLSCSHHLLKVSWEHSHNKTRTRVFSSLFLGSSA